MKLKLTPFALAVLLCATLSPTFGQVPSSQDADRTKKVVELNSDIAAVASKIAELQKEKRRLEDERVKLSLAMAQDAESRAFLQSAPYVVVRVSSDQSVVLLIEGHEQTVWLAGIVTKMTYSEDAKAFMKEQLKDGIAYLRLTDPLQKRGYVYARKDDPSLNVQMYRRGWTMAAGSGIDFDLADAMKVAPSNPIKDAAGSASPSTPTTSTPSTTSGNSSSGLSPTVGKDVNVRGYTRKDGTYVQPHTRSAPGSRKP